jgi:hypothetical protein
MFLIATHVFEQSRPQPAVLCNGMQQYRPGPGRLARHRDPLRVSPKLGNVLLNPLEGKLLVQQSCVQDTFLPDLVRRKKPKRTKLCPCQILDVSKSLPDEGD